MADDPDKDLDVDASADKATSEAADPNEVWEPNVVIGVDPSMFGPPPAGTAYVDIRVRWIEQPDGTLEPLTLSTIRYHGGAPLPRYEPGPERPLGF